MVTILNITILKFKLQLTLFYCKLIDYNNNIIYFLRAPISVHINKRDRNVLYKITKNE